MINVPNYWIQNDNAALTKEQLEGSMEQELYDAYYKRDQKEQT